MMDAPQTPRRPRMVVPPDPVSPPSSSRAIFLIIATAVLSVIWLGAVSGYGLGLVRLSEQPTLSPLDWQVPGHVFAVFAVVSVLPIVVAWLSVIVVLEAKAMRRASVALAESARVLARPATAAAQEVETLGQAIERQIGELSAAISDLEARLAGADSTLGHQVDAVRSASADARDQLSVLEAQLERQRESLIELARLVSNESRSLEERIADVTATELSGILPISDGTEEDVLRFARELADEDGAYSSEMTSPDGDHAVMADATGPVEVSADEPSNETSSIEDRLELALDTMAEPNAAADADALTDVDGVDDENYEDDDAPDDEAAVMAGSEDESGETTLDSMDDEPQLSNGKIRGDSEEGLVLPFSRAGVDRHAAKEADGEDAPVDHGAGPTPPPNVKRRRLSTAEQREKQLFESLHALSIDLNRLLDTNPPSDLWKRYMRGERHVFTDHLAAWCDRAPDSVLPDSYADDAQFRRYADNFVKQFEVLSERLDSDPAYANAADLLRHSEAGAIYARLDAAKNAVQA